MKNNRGSIHCPMSTPNITVGPTAEIFYTTKHSNQYHFSAQPFITPSPLSSHICLCLRVHISMIVHICLCPFLSYSLPYGLHSCTLSSLTHFLHVIFAFSPPYAKKGICIPEPGWQGALISSEALWKASDSAWKGDSKGNLGDIAWHVNRQSSE